jgi:hypothetical protein
MIYRLWLVCYLVVICSEGVKYRMVNEKSKVDPSDAVLSVTQPPWRRAYYGYALGMECSHATYIHRQA